MKRFVFLKMPSILSVTTTAFVFLNGTQDYNNNSNSNSNSNSNNNNKIDINITDYSNTTDIANITDIANTTEYANITDYLNDDDYANITDYMSGDDSNDNNNSYISQSQYVENISGIIMSSTTNNETNTTNDNNDDNDDKKRDSKTHGLILLIMLLVLVTLPCSLGILTAFMDSIANCCKIFSDCCKSFYECCSNNYILYTERKAIAAQRVYPFKNDVLCKKFINELNSKNKKTQEEKQSTDDNVCSICMEPFDVDNKKKWRCSKHKNIYLNCNHTFHEICLQNWVANQIAQDTEPNCPLCRNVIVENTPTISKNMYNTNYLSVLDSNDEISFYTTTRSYSDDSDGYSSYDEY